MVGCLSLNIFYALLLSCPRNYLCTPLAANLAESDILFCTRHWKAAFTCFCVRNPQMIAYARTSIVSPALIIPNILCILPFTGELLTKVWGKGICGCKIQ